MYEHNFHALCPKGHKRNFVWNDESVDKLTTIREFCIYCNGWTQFTIKKYWGDVKLLPEPDDRTGHEDWEIDPDMGDH